MAYPPGKKENPPWEKHPRPQRRQTSPGPLPWAHSLPLLPPSALSPCRERTDTAQQPSSRPHIALAVKNSRLNALAAVSQCEPACRGGRACVVGAAVDGQLPPNQLQPTTAYSSRARAGPMHKAWEIQLSSVWSNSAVAPQHHSKSFQAPELQGGARPRSATKTELFSKHLRVGGQLWGKKTPDHRWRPAATNKQTDKQSRHIRKTSDHKEVEPHLALCCTKKATPRAQHKAYWHPGNHPDETVREDVGILGV